MPSYSLTHLADAALLRGLSTLVAQDRITTAELLAHLAEVDVRELYLPAAYPSLIDYCVRHLHWCEQAAYKRIRAARAVREFPALLPAIADGRLHLSAVVLLSSHLTPENADELMSAAAHRTKAEIEEKLAERFPRTERLGLVQAVGAPAPVKTSVLAQLSPGTVVPTHSEPAPTSSVAPVAQRRYELRVTVSAEVQAKLQHAQDLLSHQLPAGDVAQVLERALDSLIQKLEHRKYAATSQPRAARSSKGDRHIPASVRRAVLARDGEGCTFTSDAGHRCESTRFLEYDHVLPVARGGESTVANLRLRCRAHNQYAAERTYGAGFMRQKREEAKERSAERRRVKGCAEELKPYLKTLGFRAQEICRAAEHCATLAGASLEDRVRAACRMLSPVRPSPSIVATGVPQAQATAT